MGQESTTTNATLADDWAKPPEWPQPDLPQDRPSSGNCSVLVLCDPTQPEFSAVQPTVIAALHHWGVPYEVCDVSARQLEDQLARGHSLLILAQQGLGRSFTKAAVEALWRAVQSGTGLLALDTGLDLYPGGLSQLLRVTPREESPATSVTVTDNRHFITAWRDEKERISFRTACTGRPLEGEGAVLLRGEDGAPMVRAGKAGAGRFVCWGLSSRVWSVEVLGHAWGLDDLFWRGVAWAARKPFVMKAMPPFITMRFDDSAGFGSLWWLLGHATAQRTPFPSQLRRILNLEFGGRATVLREFHYVDILNRFGWKPEVSLFVNQVNDADWEALRKIYERGNVQVSCHALADGYDANGHWRSHFLTHCGIEVWQPDGLRFCHSISPDEFSEDSGEFSFAVPRNGDLPPYRIVPYSDEELAANFRHLDALWRRHGIEPSRTPNIHWRNPPSNCLRFLKERGQTYSMWTARYNYVTVDSEAYNWRLLPYGDASMCLDYMPIPWDAAGIEPDDFFNAQAHVYPPGLRSDVFGDDVDFFRCVKPTLPGLTTHHDLDLVAQSIIRHAKLGLQSLFFACPLTHELNLATLTTDEWTELLQAVERGLARYPKEFVLYDTISQAARAKCETALSRVEVESGAVHVELEGQAANEVMLYLFREAPEDGCETMMRTVAPFKGRTTIDL